MGSMDLWLRWFVVLHGGFHDGADFESFVVVLVVVFSGDAHGVWFLVVVVVLVFLVVLVAANGGFWWWLCFLKVFLHCCSGVVCEHHKVVMMFEDFGTTFVYFVEEVCL
ncbi:hypothetical protein MtrunA17_Chr1g0178791 [Medicago truncatula]|uniref:Transmembrane protein n=1 Tax=Medicago truncatula TaxID=3880 RepID=A0A396JTL4_MEDTR|nr:hypothetical protein MtrunA17_Chr1g0178791 [Medicago truncatula]